jgi:putative transcriptional regulator
MYESGVLDVSTMRKFDAMCLTPVHPMNSEDIRRIRDEAGVSQAVLARVLNVTTSAVGQWERGEKKPQGATLKLLTLLQEKGLGAVL